MSGTVLGVPIGHLAPMVAAHLAHLDDTTQAEFFNVFARELVAACGTEYQAEKQAAAVNRKLTDKAKKVFGMVGYEAAP
jgi:hypothetical protein